MKNPLKVRDIKYDAQGRPSQRFIGEKATVAKNPDTGQIISVNPTSSELAAKLMQKLAEGK